MEDAGRAAEALSILEDARQTLERLRALDPRNVRLGENLFEALSNQGDVLEMLGDRAAELHLYTEAAYLSEALLADSPDDRTVQIAVTIGHQNLGVGLLETGDITAAVTRLRTANAEADAIVRRAPDNGFVRHRLAMIKARLGEALLTINSRDPEGCRVLLDGLARWDQLAASGGIPDEPNRHRPEYVTLSARCGQMLGHTR
jgi:tetratricopeptide (TPR) repeat protein